MFENNKHSIWKNKKTGNLYVVIYDEAIECTNGREDIDYTVYTSINDVKDMNGKIFVRQRNEFYQKFERINYSRNLRSETMKEEKDKIVPLAETSLLLHK